MKKIEKAITIFIIMIMLTACGTSDDLTKSENDGTNPISSITETAENIVDDETTTEWVNQYEENYRKVSKQTIDELGYDYASFSVEYVNMMLNGQKELESEACIAVVTLTNVYENERGETATVDIQIEQIIQDNGYQNRFAIGEKFSVDSGVKWTLCDDGTYEIRFPVAIMPLAEVGYKYLVYMYIVNDNVYATAMSLPFDWTNCYKKTVAIGTYEYISNETLWYYDINPSYYMEYWENNSDRAEELSMAGFDVYSKEDVLNDK